MLLLVFTFECDVSKVGGILSYRILSECQTCVKHREANSCKCKLAGHWHWHWHWGGNRIFFSQLASPQLTPPRLALASEEAMRAQEWVQVEVGAIVQNRHP